MSATNALPSAPARADRAASYPDRETAQWATQQVVTRNEQLIHRWLAQDTRRRLTIEAAWPSRPDPVGQVLLQAMMLAGQAPLDVRAARVVLRRDPTAPHGFTVHATFPIYL
ncbi:RNase A-like domain-containing protein [Streptomyces sp. PvR034]|uniref:RNase A-like domain-containing protein n=1 Tax=Streptomyces sp. PvR034 TaxID=3156401 RepID=UPI00339B9B7B